MSGSVFKRCTRCGARVKARACQKCGASTFTWSFRAYVGKNAKGRWIEQFRSGFLSKREAERALQELRSSLQLGTFVESSAHTLASYLLDEWLPATAPPRVKFETWKDRRRNLETHVIPRVGGIPLQELNAAHINRLYADLLRNGAVNGSGGLSATTVRRIHAMLRKALNDAVRWGQVQRNVALLSDPPPNKAVQASRRRSMRTWNELELRRFLNSEKPKYLYPLWMFAASTGMRRSELLGLRWSDLNLTSSTASVRQTVLDTAEGFRPVEDQKSSLSARTIHLDRRTVGVLSDHRIAQRALQDAAGNAWQANDLVFPREDGSWWNPPAISLAFQRAVKAAGVPSIRLHDLRHTHATLLLASGVNPKVVSERLGHSSVAFTLDTYAHVMPGMQPEAAERFMELVFGPEELEAEGAPNDAEEIA